MCVFSKGLLMITPSSCQSKEAMLRLWVHESCRVFHDRLINLEDKTYFKHMLAELIAKHGLGAFSYDDIFVNRNIIFGDFLRPGVDREERVYEEVSSCSQHCALLLFQTCVIIVVLKLP
jgi:dynein heavy chain, axonemal